MNYLSSSRLTLIDVCALSFKFDYVEGTNIVSPVTTWYGAFGKLCHDIFDKIAKGNYQVDQYAVADFDKGFPACEIPEDKRGEYYQKGKQAIIERYYVLTEMRRKGILIGSELEFTVGFDSLYHNYMALLT